MRILVSSALAALLALAGCARLSTDRERYAGDDIIRVHLDNRAPWIIHCACNPELEQRVGASWAEADYEYAEEGRRRTERRNPLMGQCAGTPRLGPDDRETWSVRLRVGAPSGEYRFAVGLGGRRRTGTLTTPPFRYAADYPPR